MRIIDVQKIEVTSQEMVADCFVGDGYLQGGSGTLADIDIDYESARRQEVKEYLEHRYNVDGKQRVFSAGTLTTMKIKAVVKDVARVHRVPLNVVNYITAIFDDDKMNWTGLFKLAQTNKKVKKFIADYPQVIEDIRTLMGQPRSASVHASAIIITPNSRDGEDVECFDYTPIKKVDDILVSEFDGYSLDEVGLLKNDCLGIKELSKIQSVITRCNDICGANLSFESLVKGTLDDEKTYKILSNGHTQNVFQFSSRGMTRFLMDLHPRNINDLIVAAALYRPAPIEAGSTETYLSCKRGDVAPVYLWGTHNALKNTYAVLAFQEQVSQLVLEIGGFSLGDGVKLVKLISKKRIDKIHAMKEKFMAGAEVKGCPKEDAEQIWALIEMSGSYIFNKSHATAYAITAYVGAYLKANYPTAFYTVALQWSEEKKIPFLMSEMEQCSVAKIVPPDINTSAEEFFTDYSTDEIFWSLSRIKMVGVKSVQYIIEERNKNGRFTSIENFIHRIFRYKLKRYEYWEDPENVDEANRVPVTSLHVKNMILSSCFDKISQVEEVTERYGILHSASQELGFSLSESEFPEDMVDKPYFWSMRQIETCGIGSIDYKRIYDNSDAKAELNGKSAYMTLSKASEIDNEGKRIVVCATVTAFDEFSYKDKRTGDTKKFAKLLLQQNNELIELVCWSDFLEDHKHTLSKIKDKVIIANVTIKYSDYSGANSLNTHRTSKLYTL